jgi:nitric-oxide synthase, bacterial
VSFLPRDACPARPFAAVPPSLESDPSVDNSCKREAELAEAMEFLEQFYEENAAADRRGRLEQVRLSMLDSGTYRHTRAELAWGARVAWRNSARCIGRLYWNSLQVRDLRQVTAGPEVAEHCRRHLRLASNQGRIRPVISIFAPDSTDHRGPRIWNEQLIRYAAYRKQDGGVLGDPRYLAFTERVRELGWAPPTLPGSFDVLPIVIETGTDGPQLFTLTAEDVLEVSLSHPDHPWFLELGLRWHAVPAISNMQLRIGGVTYPAAPFNGWYMGTEIGARNLVDTDRYDMIATVAARLGLDMSSEQTLWRDRSVIEINRAVLHSFNKAGVSITDHHTESQRFLTHVAREQKSGRTCPADWSWIVPPISGALTPVFHQYYDPASSGPQFVADPDAMTRTIPTTPNPPVLSAVPAVDPISSTNNPDTQRNLLGWIRRK